MPSQHPVESCYQARIRRQSDLRPELVESLGVDDHRVFTCIQIQLLNGATLQLRYIQSIDFHIEFVHRIILPLLPQDLASESSRCRTVRRLIVVIDDGCIVYSLWPFHHYLHTAKLTESDFTTVFQLQIRITARTFQRYYRHMRMNGFRRYETCIHLSGSKSDCFIP